MGTSTRLRALGLLESNLVGPTLLAALCAACVMAPSVLSPGVAVIASAGLGAFGICAALIDGRRLPTPAIRPILAAAVLAAYLTIRALFAIDPLVSLVGIQLQHGGAALWWIVVSGLAVGALFSGRRAYRNMLAVVATSGAVIAAQAIVEALLTGQRTWGSAAGALENSVSLGVHLSVIFLVSLAWFTAERSRTSRGIALACAAMAVTGIAVGESRAGVLGIVAGALTFLVFMTFVRTHRSARVISVALPLLLLTASALMIAASNGALGTAPADAIQRFGTDRDVIWRSAGARMAQSPLVGHGPDHFSSWVAWSFTGPNVDVNATYDPHNAVVAIALGGGVVGIIAWLAFGMLSLYALARLYADSGRPAGLAWLASVPCGLMGAAFFGWTPPFTAAAAAWIVGAALGLASRGPEPPTRRQTVALGIVALVLVAVCIGGSIAVWAEWSAARLDDEASSADFLALYERWPDPAYAALALGSALREGRDEIVTDTLPASVARSARWHVDLALRRIYAAQRAHRRDPETWPTFLEAIEDGRAADPSSALWDALASAEARAAGRLAMSARFARRALEMELDDSQRSVLLELAEEPGQ